MFRECYAMEKIHGTSAHIRYFPSIVVNEKIQFFSGGEKQEHFIKLFDEAQLLAQFRAMALTETTTIYGEAYGGKCQRMSNTYGKELKFVAFEVQIGRAWLSVPQAEEFVKQFNLDFVAYNKINCDVESIEKEVLLDSVQAIKNGCGAGKMREGIVLRPLIELTKNNNERILAKHKRVEFQETKTPRAIKPEKAELMRDAEKIADEWVTPMRLNHVLDAFPDADITKTGEIIKAMTADIERESVGEVVFSPEVKGQIGRHTALLFKKHLNQQLKERANEEMHQGR